MDIQQSLFDFDATIKANPELTDEQLMEKFPEFGGDYDKLTAAYDYSATLGSGKYKGPEEFNEKFPEFFPVKKKDGGENLETTASASSQSPLPSESENKIDPFFALYQKKQSALAKKEALKATGLPGGPGAVPVQPDFTEVDKEIADSDVKIQNKIKELGLPNFNIEDFQKDFGDLKATQLSDDQLKGFLSLKKDKPLSYERSLANLKWIDAVRSVVSKQEDPGAVQAGIEELNQVVSRAAQSTYGNGSYQNTLANAKSTLETIYNLTATDGDAREKAIANFKKDVAPALGRALISDPSALNNSADYANQVAADFQRLFDVNYAAQTEELRNANFTDPNAVKARESRFKDVEDFGLSILTDGIKDYTENNRETISAANKFYEENKPRLDVLSAEIAALKEVPTPEKEQFLSISNLYQRELKNYNELKASLGEKQGSREDYRTLNIAAVTLNNINKRMVSLSQELVSPELKEKVDQFNEVAQGFQKFSDTYNREDALSRWSTYIDNKVNTQFQRYPSTKADLIMQTEQEWAGPNTNPVERFIINFSNFGQGAGDFLGMAYDKVFASPAEQLENDWSRVGRNAYERNLALYETSEQSLREHPIVTVFSDEVKAKLTAIDNDPNLTAEEKYKQRYPIITAGLDDGSIYRTTNPNAGDYNISAKSVLSTISTVAPQILSQLGFTWATGGLGAASTARTMYGLFTSTFLQGYSSYHDQAVELGIANPDEYAMTHSLIDAGTEMIGMEDLNMFKSVFKDSKGFAAEFFRKLTPEKVEALRSGSKNVFKDLRGAIAKNVKTNVEEAGEEVLAAVLGNVADNNLFNQNVKVFDGASDAFLSTAIGQLPMTAIGIPVAYNKANIAGKYQMYVVGQNPGSVKDVVNDQLNKNEISQVEADKRLAVIDNMAKAVNEMPKAYQSGKPMKDEDKAKYAWNNMIINTAKSTLSTLPTDQQEKIKETIAQAEAENSAILSSNGKIAGPAAGSRLFNAPNPETAVTAEKYRQQTGMTADPGAKIEKLDTNFSMQVADAYEAMENNPSDPETRKAYSLLAKETMDQFNTIGESGYTFEIYEGQGEPYKNSEEMIKDLKDNKHLFILSTDAEFGGNPITDKQRRDNPLLQESGTFDKNGKPLLINDIFRGVHDFFGHSERGNSFGAVGEENAWDIHARMYSPLARRAMTTETRGQNSWVNFGKHLRNDQGKVPQPGEPGYKSATERPFAEQKIGLLPEEFSDLDRATPDKTNDPVIVKMSKALNSLGIKVKVVQTDAEMTEIVGQRGVGGLFIADDGTILLNKKALERAKKESRIVFHEGAHPVMNIIRNTNKELYDQVVKGLKAAAASNQQVAYSIAWAKRNYSDQGKAVVDDEALVETIAKIADGTLNLSTIPTSLKQSLIDFINKIGSVLGLPKIKDTDVAQFKKIAGQVAEALRTGTDVADIVGQENVTQFQNELAQNRIEASTVLSDETRGNKKVTEVADALEKAVDDVLDPSSDPNSRVSRFLKNAYEDLRYFFADYKGDTGLDWYTNKVKEFNLKLEDASDIAIKNGEMKEENSLKIKDNMDLFKAVLALSSIGVNPRENVKAAFAIWKTFDQATMTFSKYQPGMVSLRTNIDDGKGGYFAPSGEIVKETKTSLDIKQKNGKVITIKKSDLAPEMDVTYTNSKGVEVTKALRLVKKGAVNTVFRSGPSIVKIKTSDIAEMNETSDGIQGKGWTTKGNIVALNLDRVEKLLADKGNLKDAMEWMNKPQPINDLRKYNPGVPDINGTKGKLNPIGERYGSYIIGEKLGSFHQNVAGTPTELTMDLWWSRTWNRYMGTLLSQDEKGEQIIQETPRTDTERNIMRQAAKIAADNLGLQVHELQAALWYLEQQMYKRMGAAVESYSFVDGINEILLQYGKTTEQIRPQEYGVDSSESDQRRSDAAARAANILYGEGSEGSTATAPGNSQARKEGDLVSDAGLAKEMTEDGKGNYIFFHYSAKEFSKNNPNKFGSNNATGRDENPGIGMTMYYTRPDRLERNVPTDFGYATAVAKDKVYPFNSDPLNLLPEAEKAFRKQYGPDAAFDGNKQIGFVTKVAATKGFPITVAEWNIGKQKALRAQTTQSLPTKKFIQTKPGTLNQTEIVDQEIASYKANAKMKAQARVDDLWHGSPYSFEEFTTKKIGSGEGAQAFGWGLYFTELEGIARGYANSLSNFQPDESIADNPLAWKFIKEGRWEEYKEMGYKFFDTVQELNESARETIKTSKEAIKNADVAIANAKSVWESEKELSETQLNFFNKLLENNQNDEAITKIINERKSAVEWKMKEPNWEAMKEENIRYNKAYLSVAEEEFAETQFILDNKDKYTKKRNLYKVTVNKDKTPDQYEFLRWDKPVPGSTIQKIKDAAEKEGISMGGLYNTDNFKIIPNPSYRASAVTDKYTVTVDGTNPIANSWAEKEHAEKYLAGLIKYHEVIGNELYKQLSQQFGGAKEASLFLTRAGIDGVKYPAESMGRSNDEARGYNYVVFDENAVSVDNKFQYRKDDDQEEKDRWFAKNVLNRNPETVNKISANATKYFAISNKQTTEEVNKFMEGEDPEDIMDYLLAQPNDIPARVRIWMTGAVMDKIDELIAERREEGNNPAVERLSTKQAQLIEQIAPLGTELGQAVQAFVRLYENAAGSPSMLNFYTNKILNQVEKEKGSKLTEEERTQITELAKTAAEAANGLPKDEALYNMANYVSTIIPVQATDILEAIWYAHILSGITTQSNNFFANFWNTFAEGMVTGIRESIKNGNPMPFIMGLKGFAGGIAQGAIEGKDILMTGITAQEANKYKQNNLLEYFSWKQTKFGKLANGKVGTILDYSGGLSPKLLKYVCRALAATDAAFSRANAEAFSRMSAYVQAAGEARKDDSVNIKKRMAEILRTGSFYMEGAVNQAISEGFAKGTTAFKRRVNELIVTGRDSELNQNAKVYGSKVTLNFEPEGFMKPIYNLAIGLHKSNRVTKMFLPFTRIIVNLTENSLNYAGAGYWKAIRGTTATESGRRKLTMDERADFAIKSTIGLGTFLMLAAKTGEGEDDWFDVTANGTGNPQKNYELVQAGWRPYSIKLKSGRYITYKDWPIMPVLAAIGAMHDHNKYLKEKEPTPAAIIAMAGAVNSMWDKSVMKGLQDMMEVLSPKQAYNEMATFGSRLTSWGADQAKSVMMSNFTTQIIKLVQEANDSPIKAAKGVDRLYRDIPYLNDGLNPILNVFGEEVKPSTSERLLPITIEKVATDQLLETFNELGVFIGRPKSVDIMVDDEGTTRPMTDKEYYEYTKRAGQLTKQYMIENWEDIQEALQTTDKKERQKIAQKVVTNVTTAARKEALEIFYE